MFHLIATRLWWQIFPWLFNRVLNEIKSTRIDKFFVDEKLFKDSVCLFEL